MNGLELNIKIHGGLLPSPCGQLDKVIFVSDADPEMNDLGTGIRLQ